MNVHLPIHFTDNHFLRISKNNFVVKMSCLMLIRVFKMISAVLCQFQIKNEKYFLFKKIISMHFQFYHNSEKNTLKYFNIAAECFLVPLKVVIKEFYLIIA